MEKDSQAKLGRTRCDFCGKPSKLAVGPYVVCDAHSYRASQENDKAGIKRASVQPASLRAAGLDMRDLHS